MANLGSKRRVFNDPGHAHELTFSTYRRTRLLTDQATCRDFLRNLDRARNTYFFEVWAYVLMPDHVHLLLWPKEQVYSMTEIRASIKQPFAKTALARLESYSDPRLDNLSPNGRRHFWQTGGGYDRNINSSRACQKNIE